MQRDPEDVTETARAWIERGSRVALATVIRTWSSSPRPVGSQLVLDERGRFEGSVSGGCVETAVIDAGLDVLETQVPKKLEFGVADERAWEVGLACGGRVEVFVAPADPVALAAIAARRGARGSFGTALDLETGALEVVPEGTWPAAFDAGVVDNKFLRIEHPRPRILVIGAVHLTQVLAQLATLAGFELIAIDPRAVFATPERFAGVDLRRGWPAPVLAEIGIDAHTAIVTLSHDPKIDEPALTAALRSSAFYIGALGSRKTQAARAQRLREAGFDDAQLARIHGPVGLAIGAKSTAEIAISIMAEVIAVRRAAATGS
jgi:xanthine dehydrogenase accessory factor